MDFVGADLRVGPNSHGTNRADTHSLRFLRLRSGQAGQAPVRPYKATEKTKTLDSRVRGNARKRKG